MGTAMDRVCPECGELIDIGMVAIGHYHARCAPDAREYGVRQKLANTLRNFHRNSCYPEAMDGEIDAAVASIMRIVNREI